jgi:hypothetical protein
MKNYSNISNTCYSNRLQSFTATELLTVEGETMGIRWGSIVGLLILQGTV